MHKKVSLLNLKDIDLTSRGLADKDYISQREKFGLNEIVEIIGNPWFEIFIDTIKDPMVWFLLGIASIFYLIGDSKEAIILFSATLPLIFMDAFLHWRTQASTSALKGQLSSKVIVIRNNVKKEIDSLDIVPGDLVVHSVDNHFLPADGYWEKTEALQIDESVLTGEAFPITKSAFKVDTTMLASDILVDANMLGFAGTRVLSGAGFLRVLSTGKNTAYGEIVHSVTTISHEKTPLQIAILELTRYLIYAAIVFCMALFGIRFYQGHGWLDALLSAAVLAVAAIPEEFPVVFSFFLGVGVYRLAKQHALVRRAVSVENIGRVTQICTDKTGTITEGQFTLTHIDLAENINEKELLNSSLVASNIIGSDPIDLALVAYAKNKDLAIPQRLNVIPFTENRKRETGFISIDAKNFCCIKGAPEIILSLSMLNSEELNAWNKKIEKLATGGHKVLAVAKTEISKDFAKTAKEPDIAFKFMGLLAFEDPARPEIKEAIKYCQKNDIKVLMLTGDHPQTAKAIAKDIGLISKTSLVVSAEEEAYKFEEKWLKEHPNFFKNVDVVARCNPLQKLKIVEALKESGELVVVTGDGVNDVPALKAADIGVAMGLRGTRSAKEVSSIILTDDNFSTIVNAIREGKQLFENLRMSFKYLLLFHIPFVLSAAIIPLIGYPLLYLPIHVVWLELIIHPTALFAFQQFSSDKNSSEYIKRKSFFNKEDTTIILFLGLSFTVFLVLIFINGVNEDQNIGHGRSMVLALLSLWSAGIVVVLSKLKTFMSKFLVIITLLISIIFIQNNWLASVFHLTPLHLSDWLKCFFASLLFLVILFYLNKKKISS